MNLLSSAPQNLIVVTLLKYTLQWNSRVEAPNSN